MFAQASKSDPGDLFAFAGLSAPLQHAPTESERVRSYVRTQNPRMLLRLASTQSVSSVERGDVQQELALPPVSNAVVRLPTVRARPYLEYGVFDMMHDLPLARKAALRLEAAHVLYLGHLVQLQPWQVRALIRRDQLALDAITERLTDLSLGFGMFVPQGLGFDHLTAAGGRGRR
jgi:hypothetical protein